MSSITMVTTLYTFEKSMTWITVLDTEQEALFVCFHSNVWMIISFLQDILDNLVVTLDNLAVTLDNLDSNHLHNKELQRYIKYSFFE